jgi:hypothetical protein
VYQPSRACVVGGQKQSGSRRCRDRSNTVAGPTTDRSRLLVRTMQHCRGRCPAAWRLGTVTRPSGHWRQARQSSSGAAQEHRDLERSGAHHLAPGRPTPGDRGAPSRSLTQLEVVGRESCAVRKDVPVAASSAFFTAHRRERLLQLLLPIKIATDLGGAGVGVHEMGVSVAPARIGESLGLKFGDGGIAGLQLGHHNFVAFRCVGVCSHTSSTVAILESGVPPLLVACAPEEGAAKPARNREGLTGERADRQRWRRSRAEALQLRGVRWRCSFQRRRTPAKPMRSPLGRVAVGCAGRLGACPGKRGAKGHPLHDEVWGSARPSVVLPVGARVVTERSAIGCAQIG